MFIVHLPINETHKQGDNMPTLTELNSKLDELIKERGELQNDLDGLELDPEDYTEQYEEMLNEVYGEFMGFEAARILKELDPIAYRCSLLDYVDNFHHIEETAEYINLEEEIEAIESEIEAIEEEIDETKQKRKYVMKTKVIYREHNLYGSSGSVLLVVGLNLGLGNNYTLDHFMKSLCSVENEKLCDKIYNTSFDYIILRHNTICGKGTEYLSDFDFYCFFKPYYDNMNRSLGY